MFTACAFDRENNAVFVDDHLVEASGDSTTIYTVVRIKDDYEAVVFYENRAGYFGNQLGYTSGTESIDTRDFLVTEESLENRHQVTFSYIASVAVSVEIPIMSSDIMERLAFQMAPAAAEDLMDQPLEVEIDDSSGLAGKKPGWVVPSEYIKGWIDLDSALYDRS